MSRVKTLAAFFLLSCIAVAQHDSRPQQDPNVILQNNRPKNEKDSRTRIIQGTVKDSSDNPLSGAIVQLKDLKTSKIVDFATKEDGKFAFRDLPMDINYELLAKHGELTTPVKKVSVYDTRKEVILNFQVAAGKQ
jgi:Carboxypeptidase regulatory-like domain